MKQKPEYGISDVVETDEASLIPLIKRLKGLLKQLGVENPDDYQIKNPDDFYGSLDELVEYGYLMPPPPDDILIRTQTGHILRNERGEVVFLYIPDLSNVQKNEKKRNRVHMYWCGTLTSAYNEKSSERYWGTTVAADSGFFSVENRATVKMYACERCCDYAHRAFGDRYGTYTDFKYGMFSREQSTSGLKERGCNVTTSENDETPRYWCPGCGYETEYPEELHPKYFLCHKCIERDGAFFALRNATTPGDIENWVKKHDPKHNIIINGVTALMYLVEHNAKPDLIRKMSALGYDFTARDYNDKNVLMRYVATSSSFVQPVLDAIKVSCPELIKKSPTDEKGNNVGVWTLAKSNEIEIYLRAWWVEAGGYFN